MLTGLVMAASREQRTRSSSLVLAVVDLQTWTASTCAVMMAAHLCWVSCNAHSAINYPLVQNDFDGMVAVVKNGKWRGSQLEGVLLLSELSGFCRLVIAMHIGLIIPLCSKMMFESMVAFFKDDKGHSSQVKGILHCL